MVWNRQAMNESFYYSNISPQLASFNRGIWKKLEIQIRKWTIKFDSLYIVTGPICTNYTQTIGENKVVVPTYFYKAIVVYSDSVKQGIGFLFPHKKCDGKIYDYAVNIDSIEQITNLDLFEILPDNDEKSIESNFILSDWK